MPFDLQIAIAGLSLLCFDSSCGGSATEPVVLLVNATKEKKACDGSILPKHIPILTFSLEGMRVSSKLIYDVYVDVNGRDFGIARFDQSLFKDRTLEIRSTNSSVKKKGGHIPHSKKANKRNADAFGWVAALDAIKGAKFNAGAGDVIAKVRFFSGLFKSSGLRKDKANQYVSWKLTDSNYSDQNHKRNFPKSLADDVIVKDGRLTSLSVVAVNAQGEELILDSLSGDNAPKEALLTISNLPKPTYGSPDYLPHFKWYYELVDWEHGCPAALPYPINSEIDVSKGVKPPDDKRAVGNLLCPPVTWGSD